MADSTKNQHFTDLDKKIESVELEKTAINKEKKQFFAKITNLKAQLGLIYKEESVIESKITKIKAQEKKSSPQKKEQIEKKRWKADAKRREVEETKWQILEEIEKQEKQIKEIDLKYQEVLKEEERLKKEKEEIFRKRRREELLQKKAGLKDDFFQLSNRKKSVEGRKNEILMQEDKLETELEKILEEEKITEDALEEIETREREISDRGEKREIEKERWKIEDNRKNLEKQRWELEKEKKRLSLSFKKIEVEYQKILTKENFLKEKVKTINLELGLPYVEEDEFREREVLLKEGEVEEPEKVKPPGPAEKEERPEQKLEEMKLLELPGPPEEKKLPELEKEIKKREEEKGLQEKVKLQKKEAEERKKREKEYRAMFKKALDSYKKGEFSIAKELLNKVMALEEIKEKRPPKFLVRMIRIIRGASLQEKASDLLKKIKREEEAAEMIRKAKEEAKKREELVKKHTEELRAQKEEITRKYQEEWERQRNELLQKQKEARGEKEELRKEAMEEVIRREKMRQQETELERQKAEIKEKYEQEFQRIKKELQEQHAKELRLVKEVLRTEEIKKRQEGLRKKEEELKSREAEARKMREAPAEVLTQKEEIGRREAILKAEEEIRGKRKMIEEEAEKIEEEIRRKQLEGRREEPVVKEETEAEKEKRRAWLKEAIKKEKEMMAPEEIERERKEKAAILKTLFEEAIFHYKEKNLDRAIEIFRKLKKELPEPKKEPRFFSKIFGKAPLYIQIENYISKIEREMILAEKRKIKEIKEHARIVSGEKRKAEYKLFSKLKEKISKWIPASPLVIFRKFLFLPPLVAIDISDYSIELLRLDKNRSILTYGRTVIKGGVVHEGEIKDQKELSLFFKLAVNQAGFKSFNPRLGPILRGIVSVPEYKTNVQMFIFESRDNIFEKVKEEIKKTVPFPIDELYWDYLEAWDEKLNKTKVLVVAVLKDIIDEQIYFLRSSGVEPVVFDFEAASIGRAFLPEKIGAGKSGTMILDIGARVTNMSIFDEAGFINLSVAIPSAGDYLIDKIAEYFGVSEEEAETIMGIKGFRQEDNVILEVLEKGMEKIVEETKEAIKHYQNKTGNEIKKIILSGGTALLPEIDKFFQRSFQDVEIEIGEPLKKIKRRRGIEVDKAILYANAIGLALRSILKDPIGDGINLLPKMIKDKEKKIYWQRHRQRLIIIRIILVALILAAALLIYLYIDDFFKLP